MTRCCKPSSPSCPPAIFLSREKSLESETERRRRKERDGKERKSTRKSVKYKDEDGKERKSTRDGKDRDKDKKRRSSTKKNG